jgi:hypothetical protein
MWRIAVALVAWIGLTLIGDTFPNEVMFLFGLLFLFGFVSLFRWAWKLGDVREDD